MKSVILASQSPRRRELLLKTGIAFSVEPSSVEETVPSGLPAEETAEYLSGIKAADILKRHLTEDVIVIGSDTVVILDGVIYGKPSDEKDAFRMLRALSGRTHRVITGVTILCGSQKLSFSEGADVTFYDMTDDDIASYIRTGEPMDKAGAYGIQGAGGIHIKSVNGDYNAVIGFPIGRVYRELKRIM